jgi:hypothetical protein
MTDSCAGVQPNLITWFEADACELARAMDEQTDLATSLWNRNRDSPHVRLNLIPDCPLYQQS